MFGNNSVHRLSCNVLFYYSLRIRLYRSWFMRVYSTCGVCLWDQIDLGKIHITCEQTLWSPEIFTRTSVPSSTVQWYWLLVKTLSWEKAWIIGWFWPSLLTWWRRTLGLLHNVTWSHSFYKHPNQKKRTESTSEASSFFIFYIFLCSKAFGASLIFVGMGKQLLYSFLLCW